MISGIKKEIQLTDTCATFYYRKIAEVADFQKKTLLFRTFNPQNLINFIF